MSLCPEPLIPLLSRMAGCAPSSALLETFPCELWKPSEVPTLLFQSFFSKRPLRCHTASWSKSPQEQIAVGRWSCRVLSSPAVLQRGRWQLQVHQGTAWCPATQHPIPEPLGLQGMWLQPLDTAQREQEPHGNPRPPVPDCPGAFALPQPGARSGAAAARPARGCSSSLQQMALFSSVSSPLLLEVSLGESVLKGPQHFRSPILHEA